ncbi:3-phosphoserine/phosphohydroxythreonine transaminase [Inhella gelatinilytica]|uniref:Phosphoserine aminotransferase n=1 Tax=Inhella gelatinilytica TaxID=2795030 RepID=A0A931NBA5_9BURK|nr:3-phosphoserine/phosphohydroxythreonine transaminase [Inhella gelatinilytica]MBH9553368.1 3-phosphoserine/phosphohydroxythreonine transaminase [Inhella gelatinilytica]
MRSPRPYNFSAGPACLPLSVLEQAAAEMCDWQGTGMGVMEMSHRSSAFQSIISQAESDLRQLAQVPDDFAILFMQGGALAENAIVPLNLAHTGQVDVAVTGSWSAKSADEAARYAHVHRVTDTVQDGYRSIPAPSTWTLREGVDYVHLCSNETIDGVEFAELPNLRELGCSAPLVVDCSSNQLSRPFDWSRIGLAFGGAQKNIGPAGLTLVYARKALMKSPLAACPTAFSFERVARDGSMFNTPPTYAIYIAGLVFKWALRFQYAGLQGLAALDAQNRDKAALLYGALDGSALFENRVDPSVRSRMNVPFFLRESSLTDTFLAQASQAGLMQLKGHKSKGGCRASIYNAMPLSGVQALVDFLQDFERRHG